MQCLWASQAPWYKNAGIQDNHHSIFKDGKMIDQISTTIDPRLEDDEVLRNEYLNRLLIEINSDHYKLLKG